MQGLLQDWIELEGIGNGEVIQSGSRWPNLEGYQDVIFWLEVKMATAVSTEVRMHLQTAPASDPTLFTDMLPAFQILATATPSVIPLLQSQNPAVPLSGLIRWKITTFAAGAWRTTFRIHFVAKRR
jgi:hypothetical protein